MSGESKSRVESVFFDGTIRRNDDMGVQFVAFRVEVTCTVPEESYVLTHLRYSVLLQLHDQLTKAMGENMKDLPPFPGKTWMTPSQAVWNERCSSLNAYFHAIFSRPMLANNEAVMKMFARAEGAEDWTPTVSTMASVTEEDEKARFKFVDVETGMNIGYIDKGDSNAPLVLFVHGFPDTLWTWENVMEKVSEKGFYCVSMAQRGYYPSTLLPIKSDEPDWKRFGKHVLARDILGVVKALKKTQAILIGHDFGAAAVWAAAIMDQLDGTGLVSKVIGEAVPPPKAIAFKSALIYKARHMVYYNTPLLDTVKGTKENNFVYLESLLDRWSPTWKRSNRTLTTVKRHFSMEGRTENAIAYYRALAPPKEAKSIYDPLNTTDIKCPVLFFGGDDEAGGGMTEMWKQTAAQCAGWGEVAIILEAGHFVHLEKPNAFLHKLLPFLEMKPVSDGKQVKIKIFKEQGKPADEPKKE